MDRCIHPQEVKPGRHSCSFQGPLTLWAVLEEASYCGGGKSLFYSAIFPQNTDLPGSLLSLSSVYSLPFLAYLHSVPPVCHLFVSGSSVIKSKQKILSSTQTEIFNLDCARREAKESKSVCKGESRQIFEYLS